MTTAWQTHGNSMTNAWQLHGKRMATARQLHGNCMATAWQVHGNCMATAWQLHGNCMANTWQLHGNCMATAWQWHDNCMATAWQLQLYIKCIKGGLCLRSAHSAGPLPPPRLPSRHASRRAHRRRRALSLNPAPPGHGPTLHPDDEQVGIQEPRDSELGESGSGLEALRVPHTRGSRRGDQRGPGLTRWWQACYCPPFLGPTTELRRLQAPACPTAGSQGGLA